MPTPLLHLQQLLSRFFHSSAQIASPDTFFSALPQFSPTLTKLQLLSQSSNFTSRPSRRTLAATAHAVVYFTDTSTAVEHIYPSRNTRLTHPFCPRVPSVRLTAYPDYSQPLILFAPYCCISALLDQTSLHCVSSEKNFYNTVVSPLLPTSFELFCFLSGGFFPSCLDFLFHSLLLDLIIRGSLFPSFFDHPFVYCCFWEFLAFFFFSCFYWPLQAC